MKSKKGADIAFNLIIVAVIALIVLAVVIFILWSKGANPFTKGVSNCETLGGRCQEKQCLLLDPPRPSIPSGECPVLEGEAKQYCCANTG